MLTALNRVNPYSYNQDPTLKRMISVVPFGLPTNKPIHTRKVLKGVVKGIENNDFVIIWGGGIYNWFDPLTLIRAMARIYENRKEFIDYHKAMVLPLRNVLTKSSIENDSKTPRKEVVITFHTYETIPKQYNMNSKTNNKLNKNKTAIHQGGERWPFNLRILNH